MAQRKPTPGPWTLSDDAVRRVIKGAGAKPRTVCIIESWTTEADACLLAAAPSLRDELETLLERLTDGRQEISGSTIEEWAGEIRAALRKAGGDAT